MQASYANRAGGSGEEAGRVVQLVAQLLAKPAEDSVARLVDGVGLHSQVLGHLRSRAVLDGASPERLPGLFLEIGADELQAPAEQAVTRAGVGGVVRLDVGDLLNAAMRLGAAGRLRVSLARTGELADLVGRD